ncbi:DUF2281 domain-containing protein [Candidatus Bipolaricaulota bacterium]|nr:DUF2281 domain-containing protein [Candidatus Bipolaricaulota bacterium]
MTAKALKERLIEEIGKLPKDRLREVFDFVEYLRTREENGAATKSPEDLDPQQDPILELVGIADVEPFSQNIDEELYGE